MRASNSRESSYTASASRTGDRIIERSRCANWSVQSHPPPGLRWLGLELRAEKLLDADHGTVEFVARSKLAGRADRLHELSLFERVDGRWLYLRALDQSARS